METVLIIGKIIMIILSLGVIVAVLMQSGKSDAINGLIGASESFFSRNKGKTYEARLAKYTTIIASVLVVLSVILVLISKSVTT